MFKIGERVKHKATGIVGKIIGYGSRRLDNGSYLKTLQVELHSSSSYDSIKPIAEDLLARWQVIVRDKSVLACTLPYRKNPKL